MRIALTGGSGSLGRALLSKLTVCGADRIVVFSRDEQKRAALVRDFGWHPGVRVYAGDVRDPSRLPDLFSGCEAVIHAAARKVVTSHPDEPEEMLKTNVLGTLNVIEAAHRSGVRKLVSISSDKAVHAVNVYGVSKAMAEHLAINANARTYPHGLRIGVVRYGNVLGSNGSVLQVWRKQIAQGEPLTVTDPEATRFWITLSQAADLVLAALSNLRGGEIVVPDLPAASVGELARSLVGTDYPFAPVGDVPLERRAGHALRQGGEKTHEELLSSAETRRALKANGCYVIPPYQHDEMWDSRPWLGEPLPDGFIYRSDVWPRRLSLSELSQLAMAA